MTSSLQVAVAVICNNLQLIRPGSLGLLPVNGRPPTVGKKAKVVNPGRTPPAPPPVAAPSLKACVLPRKPSEGTQQMLRDDRPI